MGTTNPHKDLERILKALANQRRLAILALLKKRPDIPVYEIAKGIRMSMRATSQHLNILASRDILVREQKGLLVFYRLNSPVPEHARSIVAFL